MKHLPPRRSGLWPAASWAGAAALTAGFLFGSSSALAAPPPANTIIGNQASAAYTDPNGLAQTATSNLVQTTVQQVGSFTLDSVNNGSATSATPLSTKTGAAGATVYVSHVLSNTGNGPDGFNITVDSAISGFSTVAVYADANGDGLPDSTTSLCSVTPAAQCVVPTQTVAGNNGQFQFVVAYSIPSTGTTPTTPYAFGQVAATPAPANIGLYATGATVTSARDNVNLTTSAAFNMTKAVSLPAIGIAAADGGTWPLAPVSGQRSVAGCAVASITNARTPATGCSYTVYTLNFSNTGGAAGQFQYSDTLPVGFTYVAGTAVYSSNPGAAAPAATFAAAGQVLSGTIASLPVNTSQSISFVVLVNEFAQLGTTNTTNTAQYSATAGGAVTSNSNPAAYTTTGTFSFAMGAAGFTAVLARDTTPGTPNGSVAAGADTTVVASGAAGSSVPFTQVIYNTGNATDAVNIANVISPGTGGGTAFPAGTTFTYFAADGSTPLSDTNGDGVRDTGPIPAGSSVNIVVRATLPTGTAPATGPYTFTVVGTSVGAPAFTDATRDVLTAVVGVRVDMTNTSGGTTGASGDLGTGPSASPTTTLTTPAGTGVLFSLFIQNNDTFSNTYNLTAGSSPSMGALPAGWTVKFVDTASGTCASPAITQITVATTVQSPLMACVTPPASQAAVTGQAIYFQVRTTSGTVAVDTKYDAVNVTAATLTNAATLTPNNSGQVAPGGVVVYGHTLTATGTGSCGTSYSVNATGLPAGWTFALYNDVNGDGQINASDTLITPGASITDTVLAGGSRKFLVKVFAPGGAAAGATSTATVTVTFPAGAGSCGTPSATDISTVVTGQIRLVKQQALLAAVAGVCPAVGTPTFSAAPILAAKPGDCVVYQVVATNEGAAPVSNVSINDAVPAWTTFTGAVQPTTQCASTGVTAAPVTNTNYVQTSSNASCGSAANTLAPGGTVTLTFTVRIQP